MDREQVLADLQKKVRLAEAKLKMRASDRAEYSPVGSNMENWRAGMGRGMVNMTRRAANLLPEAIRPEFASDEAIAAADERDAPLMDTTAGAVGDFMGSTAVTLPIGMGAGGALARGATALRGAAPANALVRAMTATPVTGAIQGGLEGAAYSAPGDRGSGAAIGAGLGAAIPGAGKVFNRVFGKGVAQLRPEAVNLKSDGMFVPNHLAIDEKANTGSALTKAFYKYFVRNLPGTAGVLRNQEDELFNAFRTKALQQGIPDELIPDQMPEQLRQQIAQATDADEAAKVVRDFWENNAYDEVKRFQFSPGKFQDRKYTLPDTFFADKEGQDLLGYLSARGTGVQQLKKGGLSISGEDLLSVRTRLQGDIAALGTSTKDATAKIRLENMVRRVNAVIEGKLKSSKLTSGTTTPATAYRATQDTYPRKLALERAVEGSKFSRFTPEDLRKSVKGIQSPQVESLRELSKAMTDAGAAKPQAESTIWQLLATMGLVPSYAFGPAGVAGAIGVAGAAASKRGQKFMTGQLSSQQAVAKLLRENPKVFNRLRAAAVSMGAREGAE